METNQLKPCPFCGGEAVHADDQVWCSDCFISTDNANSPNDDWNNRTVCDELAQANKRITELQEELQQMNHAAKELYGVIDEYQAMPCDSLLRRMTKTAKRYKKTIFDNIIWMGLRHK